MNLNHRPIQIIGVPVDLGASRRGTDAGPSALRKAGLADKLLQLGHQVTHQSDIVVPAAETRHDGDKNLRFKNEILQICHDLARATCSALNQGYFPLVIGGDHSLSMGSVSGVSSFYQQHDQRIGLIWFDAHGDMNTPQSSPSGNINGMPLAHILGYGDSDLISIAGNGPKVKAANVALVGIRDIDKTERELIHRSDIHTFTMRDIDEQGMASTSQQVIEIVTDNTAGFHLSFDVDVCDPSIMSGSGSLSPGGVSLREAHLLHEVCAESGRMVSMDVAELNPFLDRSNVSVENTISLVQSAFGRSIL